MVKLAVAQNGKMAVVRNFNFLRGRLRTKRARPLDTPITNESTNRCKNQPSRQSSNQSTNQAMRRPMCKESINASIDERMGRRMDQSTNESTNERMTEWMHEWTCGRTNERMKEWMGRPYRFCHFYGFSPPTRFTILPFCAPSSFTILPPIQDFLLEEWLRALHKSGLLNVMYWNVLLHYAD